MVGARYVACPDDRLGVDVGAVLGPREVLFGRPRLLHEHQVAVPVHMSSSAATVMQAGKSRVRHGMP